MTKLKMWAVHDGPGNIEWGPFGSYDRAHSFVNDFRNDFDFKDIYEINVPDINAMENRLEDALRRYAEAYDKWKDKNARDLRYTLKRPKMAVVSKYPYPLTRANISNWYRCAHPEPLHPNDYTDIRDFNSDIMDWMDDADTILFALDCAIAYLSQTVEVADNN